MTVIRRPLIYLLTTGLIFGLSLNSTLAGSDKAFDKVKNVIIMISDGAGYNTHLSTEYWHGEKQPYDNPRFAKYAVATYNLRYGGPDGTAPGDNSQDPTLVYDPKKAWDDPPPSRGHG